MPKVKSLIRSEDELRHTIAGQIRLAYEQANQADRTRGLAWLAHEMQVSISKLNRILTAKADPDIVEMWRLSRATRKPISWFAGEAPAAAERLAAVAESAETRLAKIEDALARLLQDLTAARREVAEEISRSKVDRTERAERLRQSASAEERGDVAGQNG